MRGQMLARAIERQLALLEPCFDCKPVVVDRRSDRQHRAHAQRAPDSCKLLPELTTTQSSANWPAPLVLRPPAAPQPLSPDPKLVALLRKAQAWFHLLAAQGASTVGEIAREFRLVLLRHTGDRACLPGAELCSGHPLMPQRRRLASAARDAKAAAAGHEGRAARSLQVPAQIRIAARPIPPAIGTSESADSDRAPVWRQPWPLSKNRDHPTPRQAAPCGGRAR